MFLKISELRSLYFSETEKSTFSEDANKDIPKKDNKNKFLVIFFNFK